MQRLTLPHLSAFALFLTLTTLLHAQSPPPSPRPSMQSFQIPSHGSLLNAFLYLAAGHPPHPTVVLLHGFPGNERNLDLAQNIRKAGWNVLYLDYRGSWGSPGDYSFTHGIEDTAAAVAYLRSPVVATRLHVDPTHIVLLGHSMGGFMAVQSAAADPTILATGLISAADIGSRIPQPLPKSSEDAAVAGLSRGYAGEGMAPLAGCTPASLARETIDNAAQWAFPAKAAALKSRPILIVTSDDGLAPVNDRFAAALKAAGETHLTTLHLSTDHVYSDQRDALSTAVLAWLNGLR